MTHKDCVVISKDKRIHVQVSQRGVVSVEGGPRDGSVALRHRRHGPRPLAQGRGEGARLQGRVTGALIYRHLKMFN